MIKYGGMVEIGKSVFLNDYLIENLSRYIKFLFIIKYI